MSDKPGFGSDIFRRIGGGGHQAGATNRSQELVEAEVRRRALDYRQKADEFARLGSWDDAREAIYGAYDTIWSNIEGGCRTVQAGDVLLLLDAAWRYCFLQGKKSGVEQNVACLQAPSLRTNPEIEKGLQVVRETAQLLGSNMEVIRSQDPDGVGAFLQIRAAYECALGRPETATDLLQQAVQLREDPVDKSYCYRMCAVAHYRQGALLEAADCLARAEAHGHEDIQPQLEQIRRELSQAQ